MSPPPPPSSRPLPPPIASPRRKGKDVPRLPLSAFSPPNTGTSDIFPIPPTPSLITPRAVVDSHLHVAPDDAGGYNTDGLFQSDLNTAVVLVTTSPSSRRSTDLDLRVLAVLTPFSLQSPQHAHDPPPLALTTTYDGTPPVAADAEDNTKAQAQVETPVTSLRWALQHARVVDLDIQRVVMDTDPSAYDSFVNLLTKAIKSDSNPTRTPIVLTNLLPPPLDAITPVVAMMNHPTYTTYRQRVSLLSLFESVFIKLLPPAWISAELQAESDPKQEKEFRDMIKLFIVPVLEAFGFERIIFGCSPASAHGSASLSENWYRLVLNSFRELAVSQDEMDKIFIDNAERVYSS